MLASDFRRSEIAVEGNFLGIRTALCFIPIDVIVRLKQ
jgi:hypothetical protein